MSLPITTRIKAASSVLGAMSSVNAALERGLQHRVADFSLQQRFSNQAFTYDSNGDKCPAFEQPSFIGDAITVL